MKKQTVLVVDDSSTIRTIIARELESVGYEVIAAENGMEALAMIEWMSDLPDIITLDIDMPVMGGFEVCERLRAAKDSAIPRKTAGCPCADHLCLRQ
jgi:two-component system, cell cycle response regulator